MLISASLVVAFVETMPAALLLAPAWLEASFGLADQEHSHKRDRRGRETICSRRFGSQVFYAKQRSIL